MTTAGRKSVLSLIISVGLLALATAVFSPVGYLDFVWDDFDYLHFNPILTGGPSLAGAWRAFVSFHSANWHPVTWLSHMADLALFGLVPAGHHLVNLLLHGANAVLLFLLLAGMTGRPWTAAIVASLFAVHPLRVEPVAWVAERKELLASFFGLGTLLAYLRYLRKPAWHTFTAAVGLLALGLAAKPMVMTLPLLMLLLDWWPFGRGGTRALAWWSLMREKLPFAALAAISAMVTLAAQSSVGAIDPYPFAERLANALRSYVAYLGAAFWPVGLAAFYPLRHTGFPVAMGAATLFGLATALAVRARRREPWLLMGWAWYVITLIPVIGLVQVGAQAMADRYMYLPLTGILMAVVWSLADVVRRRRIAPFMPAAATAVVLASLTLATRALIPFWQDEVALWSRAAQISPGSNRILLNLGVALMKRGSFTEAEDALRAALTLAPHDTRTLTALGALLVEAGRESEGAALLEQAVRGPAPSADAALRLGIVRARQGNHEAATALYRLAVDLDPGLGAAHNNLGVLLAARGDYAGAILQFREGLRLNPSDRILRRNLGHALERSGNLPGALDEYETVLEARSGDTETQAMRDRVLDRLAGASSLSR